MVEQIFMRDEMAKLVFLSGIAPFRVMGSIIIIIDSLDSMAAFLWSLEELTRCAPGKI